VPAGRLYKDGDIVIDASDRAIAERRKLAFAGVVTVAIAIDDQGEIAGDPIIDAMGLPEKNRKGEVLTDLVADAVGDTLDGLSKARRRDPEAVETAVERAVRNTVNQVWGKKPACHILVVEV
jgi:ribonuclease J